MKRFLTILMLMTGAIVSYAHYSIHSVTGNVTIESSGKSESAVKGKQVKATDYIVIPKGGKIEIYNDLDKRIYASIQEGKVSVTRLLIEAKRMASDNSANVAAHLRFGKKNNSGDKVYVEKGMVRRSLAVYDPQGNNIEIDAQALGGYLASVIKSGKLPMVSAEEKDMVKSKNNAEGLGFCFENKFSFPIYFNVIKVGEGENPTIEISRLGQPAGSYVILPGQTLSRHDPVGDEGGDREWLMMTHCQYDVDAVIEEIFKAFANPVEENDDMPVTIIEL